jgi:hypothetical protein
MANAPLSERDGEIFKSDLGLPRSRFFLQTGLDRFSRAKVFLPDGQITNGQALRYAVRKRQERIAFFAITSHDACLANASRYPCETTRCRLLGTFQKCHDARPESVVRREPDVRRYLTSEGARLLFRRGRRVMVYG